MNTQELLQNRRLCHSVYAQLYCVSHVLSGHPGAADWGAVGVGLRAMALHCGSQLVGPGPAYPRELHLSEHAENAHVGREAGKAQGPSVRLRYSHVSEPRESKTVSMQPCSGLSVSGHHSGQTRGNICSVDNTLVFQHQVLEIHSCSQ